MPDNAPPKTMTLRNLTHLAAIGLLCYIFLLLLKPLADPDLWWHLKTGETIMKEMALPGREDPFSFTTPKPLSEDEVAGIRSQWLGDVFFYLAYLIGGYPGLAVFRALMALAPAVFLYVRSVRRGGTPILLLPGLAFPPLIISFSLFYTYERPQALSFLMSLIVYFLLLPGEERRGGEPVPLKKMSSLKLALLPVVMAAWSNMHGGYVAGVAIIALYAAGEAAHILAAKAGLKMFRGPRRRPLYFFIASIAAVAATGLNPGGYRLMAYLLALPARLLSSVGPAASNSGGIDILEYKSLWFFYEAFHLKWPLFMMAFIALGFLSLALKYLSEKELDLSEALVFLSVGVFGALYARGVNFSLIFAALAVSGSMETLRRPALNYLFQAPPFSKGGRGEIFIKPKEGWRAIVIALMALAVLLATLAHVYSSSRWELKPRLPGTQPEMWVNTSIYPEGAVQFIREHKIEGPMFNDLKWGGYLIWRLYPEYKVFFDTRWVSSGMAETYLAVERAGPGWRGLLDTFNINFILVPVMSKESGVASFVVLSMAEDKPGGWALVYLRDNTALFVRRRPANQEVPGNQEVIDCCDTPFNAVYPEMLRISDGILAQRPGHTEASLSKAIALMGLGRRDEAGPLLKALPDTLMRRVLLERLNYAPSNGR